MMLLMFVVWVLFGIWMFRCLGRTPKQCLQCILGRYIGLFVVLALITACYPK